MQEANENWSSALRALSAGGKLVWNYHQLILFAHPGQGARADKDPNPIPVVKSVATAIGKKVAIAAGGKANLWIVPGRSIVCVKFSIGVRGGNDASLRA